MDAGWAAVLGAVIGAVAGVAGGMLGAWLTGRALLRQTRAAAQSQHAQWLYEQRKEAYAALLVAFDDHRAALVAWGEARKSADDPGAHPDNSLYASVNSARTKEVFKRERRMVDVVGPDHVKLLLVVISEQLHQMENLYRFAPADVGDLLTRELPVISGVERAEHAFVVAAAAVVGTAPAG